MTDPTPLRIRKPDPDPAVIDAALRLLRLARSGEAQGIIYAAALAGGSTRIAEAGTFPSAAERVGAAHMLAYKVTSGVMDHDTQDDPQPPEPDDAT